MGWRNTTTGYGWPSVALHWLILVLIAGSSLSMELRGIWPKDSPQRETMALWHYALGLSVFGLAWLRLLARLAGSKPRVEPPLERLQAKLAATVQRALYVLMFALPLLGWFTLAARGVAAPVFGIELPALSRADENLASWFEWMHTSAGIALYLLLGLHASAALYHHYILGDNTLRLMWPGR